MRSLSWQLLCAAGLAGSADAMKIPPFGYNHFRQGPMLTHILDLNSTADITSKHVYSFLQVANGMAEDVTSWLEASLGSKSGQNPVSGETKPVTWPDNANHYIQLVLMYRELLMQVEELF